MAIARGRRVVEPPSITPTRFGILSAATPITDGDSHWEGGILFQPDVCARARSTADNCTTAVTKSPVQAGLSTYGADAFTVYAWIDCSPVGNWEQYAAITDAALTNGEGRAVGHVFWTGDIDDAEYLDLINPHLAANAIVTGSDGVQTQIVATVVTTGAVDIVEALGTIEGALGAC